MPDFPDALRLKVVRILRNEPEIEDYDAKVRAFLAEVDREVESIRTLSDLRGQLEKAAS